MSEYRLVILNKVVDTSDVISMSGYLPEKLAQIGNKITLKSDQTEWKVVRLLGLLNGTILDIVEEVEEVKEEQPNLPIEIKTPRNTRKSKKEA